MCLRLLRQKAKTKGEVMASETLPADQAVAATTASIHDMDDRFLGCILAGAVGDNLGSVVEFEKAGAIFNNYGPLGVHDIETYFRVSGAITDDTQMSLYTAEALISSIRTHLRAQAPGSFKAHDATPALYQSYLRWLASQSKVSKSVLFPAVKDLGWLRTFKALNKPRAPGLTCLNSLCSGKVGSETAAINDSKGCGGVMRTAPCALAVHAAFSTLTQAGKAELAYELGCTAAVITHCHPSGYISAGCLPAIISHILSGESLDKAISLARELARKRHLQKSDETVKAIDNAVTSAREFNKLSFKDAKVGELEQAVVTHVHILGGGWVGEEALAIALFCCLISPDNVENALRFAVNHSGDSDSTGAITGNIIGAILGHDAIPPRFRDGVELQDVLRTVAHDLLNLGNLDVQDGWDEKYPPAIAQ